MITPRPWRQCAAGLICAGVLWAQSDVLTANYNTYRTNSTTAERILNTSNVNSRQFGRLGSFPVDGQVFAQPLYVKALDLPGRGPTDVLFVATMHNSVYAFDARGTGPEALLWQTTFGKPVDPAVWDKDVLPFTDIKKEVGILSTPVIDRATNTLYVVNETSEGGFVFYLHALDLATGADKFNGPTVIEATVEGSGWGGEESPIDLRLRFNAYDHIQRPALLLANGSVYVGFGSHGDLPPWHGWLIAYKATDLREQTLAFCTSPYEAGVSIWQGGRGPAVDEAGDVYLSTGNGSFDAWKAWGQSVLRLTGLGDPKVADWFTPAEYEMLNDEDQDFGANGPILIPGTDLLVAGGKSGKLALMKRSDLGHEWTPESNKVQIFQAVKNRGKFGIFNSALWNSPQGPVMYVWGYGDALRAYRIENGRFNETSVSFNATIENYLPFSGFAVSSNGLTPGSAILWATSVIVGDEGYPAPGTLHALDAADVGRALWNSDQIASRDAMGNHTKFANPTVADARVFVPTDSNQIAIYGLLDVGGVVAVASAASYATGPVSPGELIAIFGNRLGPSSPAYASFDGNGRVATEAGGVRVTFDGVAAPLLYASTGQVNAIVPFSVAGKTTVEMSVRSPGGESFTSTVPVIAADPAAFALAGSQGAILHLDYSVNGADNAAARGSVVSIYATGLGNFTTLVADGAVLNGSVLPILEIPVTVTIGGRDARVLYAGPAPGQVAGVMQINVEIPRDVIPSPAAPVRISSGAFAARSVVTVAVK